MNEIMQAFALIGAYFLGAISLLGLIAYCLKRDEMRKSQTEALEMEKAVETVQTAMPGTTILNYEKN